MSFRLASALACSVVILFVGGCAPRVSVGDLREVFGGEPAEYEERTLWVDLNGDGRPERLVLFVSRDAGIELPRHVRSLESGRAVVEGIALFDGRHPDVCVFYWSRSWRFALRVGEVEGQRMLISDGGRGGEQFVWGWWRSPGGWPPARWEARLRVWEGEEYGPWRPWPLIAVEVSK
jgi:hypothetical protein